MTLHRPFSLVAAVVVLFATQSSAEPSSGYKIARKVHVGGDGGWDYLAVDAPARRLYVTHGTRVLVFDADTVTQVGEIANTAGVHGVAIAPELHRGFTSNGKTSTVTIFDLTTLARIDEIKVSGENPDAILYDPASRRVFAFNGRSANATVLDAATGRLEATLPLPGKPEFATTDSNGRAYVNIEDKSEVTVLDTKKPAVLEHWPLAPCEEPTGMAIDRKSKRLFIGCGNRKMAVIDAATGRLVTTLPIGDGVDANAFDPGTALAFSSNGDGTLTVVSVESPDKFTVLENVATQRGARTMALDEKTHRIFLSTADFGPPPPATAEQPHPRPSVVPDSFTILVLDR
jgi:DNA-binding beta-propeller fold protein YncE